MKKSQKNKLILVGLIFSFLTPILYKNLKIDTNYFHDFNQDVALKYNNADWDNEIMLPTTYSPFSTFVGDVNNDGFNDIVFVYDSTDNIGIFTWNSTAKDWNNEIIRTVGDGPYGVFVGDANNDGYNDIVTGNRYTNDVSILLWNNVTGNWGGPISKAVGDDPRVPCIGDVNNDGYNDIITPNYAGSDISILLWNNMTGDWDSAISKSAGSYTTCAYIGDVNNDGYNDIVAGNHISSDISIYLWNNNIDNWNPVITKSVTSFPYSMFIADANNDGFNDIIFGGGNGVSIFIWNTLISDWNPEIRRCIGFGGESVYIGDANNDGSNDIVVTDKANDRISVTLWNRTIGNWNGDLIKTVGDSPTGIFIGDVNNDGYNDIVCSNSFVSYASVFLWDVPPTIEINTPYNNEVFGKMAPKFNIKVKEASIDSMWYTLDGGISNKTFFTNTTIDQLIWDDVGNGSVLIDFYVNDTTGNVGSASVLVRKDEYSPAIAIIEPTNGEEFSKYPPIYNITIDEANLADTWYSIDGGITNISFSCLYGVIDEQLWQNAPDGPITVTFYAKDIANNTGFTTVDIIKNTLQSLNVKIVKMIYSMDTYNLTFSIVNETNNGIDSATIFMWWNGIDVSSDIQNYGNGLYFVSLDTITVAPGEDPIPLNMTVLASGYKDKYFEIYIAVDPATLLKGGGGPGEEFPITLIIIISIVSAVAVFGVVSFYLLRKRKSLS
ncbi:MAG: FG-GAP repeat domain-containing protein [Promethearchaeota archaeon]